MGVDDPHRIREHNDAYRRGLVLGLTMAEVGILIIFALLLLIGLDRWAQAERSKKQTFVARERLDMLEQNESLLTALREAMQLKGDDTSPEVEEYIRVLLDTLATPGGEKTLSEMRKANEERRKLLEEMKAGGGADTLIWQLEQQKVKIANQEGQLQHYEKRLAAAGLGKGERPCWVKPDGTIEYLYDIVLTSTGIRMREYDYPARISERSGLPMPDVDPDVTLSPGEFLRLTEPLYQHSQADSCRFFVVVYDATGPTEKELYKELLRAVEGHFYKRLDRDPAPF